MQEKRLALARGLKQKKALVETSKLLLGTSDILKLFLSLMVHGKELMEVSAAV